VPKKLGRPKAKNLRTKYLELRLTPAEKKGFQDAAALAGIELSSWARERLRRAAVKELKEASIQVAFLE
jgi:uncharacterized protein (DUF1778 family)